MLHVKPTALCCSCCHVQHGLVTSSWASPPLSSRPFIKGNELTQQRTSQRRSFASVLHDSHSQKPNDHHHHRQTPRGRGEDHHLPWPTSERPTPYEIFCQSKGAPYSKARFYELAKLYHPDRHHHTSRSVSQATKIERYRLIVAANEILCNPARRRSYDMYGAGWNNVSDMRNISREAEKTWRQQPGSAANNATWEDWERWYEARDGKKQQDPVFMSNGLFATAVVALVGVGIWGRATMAGKNSMTFMEMREEQDRKLGQGLREHHLVTSPLTREGRVETFLRQRDVSNASAYDTPRPEIPAPEASKLHK